jgi:hypothetical protein
MHKLMIKHGKARGQLTRAPDFSPLSITDFSSFAMILATSISTLVRIEWTKCATGIGTVEVWDFGWMLVKTKSSIS